MLNKARPAGVQAEPAPADTPSLRRPGRQGKSNVTGYFAPTVKRQLRRLAADSDRTIQSLMGEVVLAGCSKTVRSSTGAPTHSLGVPTKCLSA